MAKKKDKDYSIRTLSYYQMEGGIYNDLITALQRLRQQPSFTRLMAPNQILNKATDLYDYSLVMMDDDINYKPQDADDLFDTISAAYMDYVGAMGYRTKIEDVIIAVYACLLSREGFFKHCILDLFKFIEAKPIVDTFKPIAEKTMNSQNSALQSEAIIKLQNRISNLESEIMEKDEFIIKQNEQMAIQSQVIDSHLATINRLNKLLSLAEKTSYEGSTFDRLLTLDYILKWIEGRHHYNYTEQVFRMLADMKDDVATDEERQKIREVENRMLDKNQIQAVFNQNFALNSNMMTGMVSNPQLPIGVSPADMQQLFQQFLNQLDNGQQQG